MTTTLTRQGDKVLLEIDPKLLDQLGINEQTPLTITAEGNTLRVAPAVNGGEASDDVDDATFRATHAKVIDEWQDVFKKLAE